MPILVQELVLNFNSALVSSPPIIATLVQYTHLKTGIPGLFSIPMFLDEVRAERARSRGRDAGTERAHGPRRRLAGRPRTAPAPAREATMENVVSGAAAVALGAVLALACAQKRNPAGAPAAPPPAAQLYTR